MAAGETVLAPARKATRACMGAAVLGERGEALGRNSVCQQLLKGVGTRYALSLRWKAERARRSDS